MDEFYYNRSERIDTQSTVHRAKTERSLSMSEETSDTKGTTSVQASQRVTSMFQKENQLNLQDIAKDVKYKTHEIPTGQSLSKVQSLSSIRDVGCTNPMAYTLWHHPTLNENNEFKLGQDSTGSSIPNLNHNDRWTIHENWDLLNRLDSTPYVPKSIATPNSFKTSWPQLDEENDTHDDNDDDHDDVWNNGSSPLFVPVTKPKMGGVTATTSAAVLRDEATIAGSATGESNQSMGTLFHRRHSLPEFISKPIAVRPLSSSSWSSLSSGLKDFIK